VQEDGVVIKEVLFQHEFEDSKSSVETLRK